MLYRLIDQLCSRIDSINIDSEAPVFSAQLQKMRPGIKAEFAANGIEKEQIMNAIQVLSAAELTIIKGLPAIAKEMAGTLSNGGGDPAFRCILAASLAYLVQPNDLLPDNLPGGYGFVDDALMLHEACALSWEVTGNMKQAEEKRKIFQFLFLAVPDNKLAEFRSAISGMAITLNVMRNMEPMVAQMTTQIIIDNPLEAAAPQEQAAGYSPMGNKFASYPGSSGPQYSWQSGNTMGVNFPGGGGVATDGRNVFML
jgi:uncharacterized membrane protein YkvA (DUF1232 family)